MNFLTKQQVQQPSLFLDDEFRKKHLLLESIAGSRAYGLSNDDSDVDIRGVYLLEPNLYLGLDDYPKTIENTTGDNDAVFWELGHFLKMLLKSNPTTLEVLNSSLFVSHSLVADELQQNRQRFLSKMAYQPYVGYANGQLKRGLEKYSMDREPDYKNLMHCLRMMYCAETLFKEGRVVVDLEEEGMGVVDYFKAIRNGEYSVEIINTIRSAQFDLIDEAYSLTTLPDKPDYDWTNSFLIDTKTLLLKGE